MNNGEDILGVRGYKYSQRQINFSKTNFHALLHGPKLNSPPFSRVLGPPTHKQWPTKISYRVKDIKKIVTASHFWRLLFPVFVLVVFIWSHPVILWRELYLWIIHERHTRLLWLKSNEAYLRNKSMSGVVLPSAFSHTSMLLPAPGWHESTSLTERRVKEGENNKKKNNTQLWPVEQVVGNQSPSPVTTTLPHTHTPLHGAAVWSSPGYELSLAAFHVWARERSVESPSELGALW